MVYLNSLQSLSWDESGEESSVSPELRESYNSLLALRNTAKKITSSLRITDSDNNIDPLLLAQIKSNKDKFDNWKSLINYLFLDKDMLRERGVDTNFLENQQLRMH